MCSLKYPDTIISVLSTEVSLQGYYPGISLHRPVADLFDDVSKQELASLIKAAGWTQTDAPVSIIRIAKDVLMG